jgi:hypothetical protein
VVVPFGRHTDDYRLAARAIAADAAAQVAANGGAAGERPVAWTMVRGRTDAGNSVGVNGLVAMVAADGRFEAEVPLHVGENSIDVTARTPGNLTNHAQLTVMVSDRDPRGRRSRRSRRRRS